MTDISRNAPCPCGSGKKYKRCCGQNAPGQSSAATAARGQPANAPLQQAVSLYQKGDFAAAGRLCDQLLQQNPRDIDVIELGVVLALQSGNWAGGRQLLEAQIRLQPDNPFAHCNLGLALTELGEDELAYRHCRQALSIKPQLPEAHNNIGRIHQRRHNLDQALESYQKALDLGSNDPRVYVNAGMMQQLLGDLPAAEKTYRKVLKRHPDFFPAHNNLGAVLRKLGRPEEARRHFERIIEAQPEDPEALNNLGSVMMDLGELEAARGWFERAIELAPRYIGAYVNLGYLSEIEGSGEASRHYYEQALAIDPDETLVNANLGYRYFELGEQPKALEHFQRALERDPHNAMALAGLGEAELRGGRVDTAARYIEMAMQLGDYESSTHRAMAALAEVQRDLPAATREWRRVIELAPNNSRGYIGLAQLLFSQDRFDEAREVYQEGERLTLGDVNLYHNWSRLEEHTHNLQRAEALAAKALDFDPAYPGQAILGSTLARRRNAFDEALGILQQIEPEAIGNKLFAASYQFELGAVLDKLGRYQEAFAAYRAANELKNRYLGSVYEDGKDLGAFQLRSEVFSEGNLSKLSELAAELPPTPLTPVFIVGFPRSGTSLLEQILGAHAQIHPAGELTTIWELANGKAKVLLGGESDYPSCLVDPERPLTRQGLLALRDYYLTDMEAQAGSEEGIRWVTDKMPHNALNLGLISLLFPESPIIHISRHPLDACLSAYFSNFSGHRYTSSLESTAIHYQRVMDGIEHYKRVLKMRFLEIRYQDLIDDQAAVVKRLLAFIGAPWDEHCLQHHKSARVVRTASYEQVTQKVYRTSLARYLNYWDVVQPIIPIVQPTIDRFDYPLK